MGHRRQRPALWQPLPAPGRGHGACLLWQRAAVRRLLVAAACARAGHRAAGGPGGGAAVPVEPAATVDPRHRSGAPGQRGQEPLPGQHEPRVPHPAQWPVRHVRAAGHHPPGRGAARMRAHHPGLDPQPDGPGRGRAGHLGDRGGQAAAHDRRFLAARAGDRNRPDPASAGARKERGLPGGDRPGRAGDRARRCRPPAPGADEPGRQRGQVHRQGAGAAGRGGGAAGAGGVPGTPAFRGDRHRHRHPGGDARAPVRCLRAGRRWPGSSPWRHRAGNDHRQEPDRGDGRTDRLRECRRSRQPLLGRVAVRRARGGQVRSGHRAGGRGRGRNRAARRRRQRDRLRRPVPAPPRPRTQHEPAGGRRLRGQPHGPAAPVAEGRSSGDLRGGG